MELVLILVVALLVLGPKRMPELARTLGKGLSEFRRASNELRQSLAIDEIQNELRDGIAGAGQIHRPVKPPEADDKPAQAGDDLTPGPKGKTPHPGELPLDADPHAHHEGADGETEGEIPVDGSGEGAAGEDEAAAGSRSDAAATASPADPGLGTVPVSRTANRPVPPRPATERANADRPAKDGDDAGGSTDERRG